MTSEEGFEAFDHDGDGLVSLDDLSVTAADLSLELSDDDLVRLHVELDLDGDGMVSLQVTQEDRHACSMYLPYVCMYVRKHAHVFL
jgi:Ca2+-binding EF-hand superfamily protein